SSCDLKRWFWCSTRGLTVTIHSISLIFSITTAQRRLSSSREAPLWKSRLPLVKQRVAAIRWAQNPGPDRSASGLRQPRILPPELRNPLRQLLKLPAHLLRHFFLRLLLAFLPERLPI